MEILFTPVKKGQKKLKCSNCGNVDIFQNGKRLCSKCKHYYYKRSGE